MLVALSLVMALIPQIGRPVEGLLWGATVCYCGLAVHARPEPGTPIAHRPQESPMLDSQGSQWAPGASLICNLGTRPKAVAKTAVVASCYPFGVHASIYTPIPYSVRTKISIVAPELHATMPLTSYWYSACLPPYITPTCRGTSTKWATLCHCSIHWCEPILGLCCDVRHISEVTVKCSCMRDTSTFTTQEYPFQDMTTWMSCAIHPLGMDLGSPCSPTAM